MNVLNILPLEISQIIYKNYFKTVLLQIQSKTCFTTLYLDAKCTKTTKCSCVTNEGAFCRCCNSGTIKYY